VHLLSGSSFAINGAISSTNLEFAAGTLGGTSTISGVFNWTGGTLDTNLTMPAGTALNISGDADKIKASAPLSNAGTVTWTGTGNLRIAQSGSFTNQAGGMFRVQTDAILNPYYSTFTNAGTFTKSVTGGTTSVPTGNGVFVNTGLVDVQTGTLSFP